MPAYQGLRIDETGIGKRYGDWTQIGPAFRVRAGGKNRSAFCVCECKCGHLEIVFATNLSRKQNPTRGCFTCGKAKTQKAKIRHGMSRTRVHNIWCGMLTRCSNPNIKAWGRYGGRGIKVCERWQVFENFLSDMGQPPTDSHTIERTNNDGDYEPGNCIWLELPKQAANTRRTRKFQYGDKYLTLQEIAERSGVSRDMLHWRLKRGFTLERAISQPSRKPQRQRIA